MKIFIEQKNDGINFFRGIVNGFIIAMLMVLLVLYARVLYLITIWFLGGLK
jgi:hypothetical protein